MNIKRQLGFRGMDTNGDWHYGLLAQSAGLQGQPEEGVYISNTIGKPYAFLVRPETIGEFTGLKDKNGQDIYEGDILTHEDKDLHVVEYNCGRWSARLLKHVGPRWPAQYLDCSWMHWEIVGNIYENPSITKDAQSSVRREVEVAPRQ